MMLASSRVIRNSCSFASVGDQGFVEWFDEAHVDQAQVEFFGNRFGEVVETAKYQQCCALALAGLQRSTDLNTIVEY